MQPWDHHSIQTCKKSPFYFTPLGDSNSVATFHMALCFDKFKAFCTKIEADLDNVNTIVMDAEVVNNNNNTVAMFDNSWEPNKGVAISEGYPPFISLNLDGPTNEQGKEILSVAVNNKEDRQPTSNSGGPSANKQLRRTVSQQATQPIY